MKILILLMAFAIIGLTASAQTKPTYVDGVKISQQEADKLKMDDIAAMSVDKDGNHITSRGAACNAYWNFFKSKSPQYASLVPTIQELYKVQYIINGTVLTSGFDGTLANVSEGNFVSITMIDQATLSKDYGVSNKPYGVIIKTKKAPVK